jgi:lysyl-tRNA synthetase class 2
MVLEIEFRNGAVYQYFAVPLAIYNDLMRAPSKGRFFHRSVEPRFRYQRVS